MKLLAAPLCLAALAALAPSRGAQITVDAGPDRSVAFPSSLALDGTIDGLTPVDFWTADGNGTEENKLVKFNSETGVSFAGPIQTTGGSLYGFVNDIVEINDVAWGVAPLLRQMFTLNGATGIATNVGGPMSAPSIRGLAYDDVHNVLYGIDYNNNGVYTINTTTGLSTRIVTNVGHAQSSCLAYEESSGLLYAYGESSDWLFTIDPVTDVVTDLIQLPTTLDETYDELQFFEGELYGMWWRYSTFDCELRRIDIGTGDYEVVATLEDVSSHCLLVNSVPEHFEWRKEGGPGTVTFSDPESLNPVVDFSTPGSYRLSLVVDGPQGPVKDILRVLVVEVAGTPGLADQSPTPLPNVSFTSSAQTAAEGATTVLATVQLSAASTHDISVPLTIAGNAALPADYSVSQNPIVITAGLLSADLVLTLADDPLDEDDETVELSLGRPALAGLGAVTAHVVTIADDDVTPTVAFTAATQSADESSGTATISVQLSAESGRTVSVLYALSGSADLNDDYDIPASPLVIAPGQSGADLVVSIVDDALVEGDETVQVTLGMPTNAELGTPSTHELTLLDDDSIALGALALDVDPAEWTLEVGETLVLRVLNEDAGQLVWSVSTPAAGGFQGADGPAYSGKQVRFVAGALPGAYSITVTERETGRSGVCTLAVEPLAYDVSLFASAPRGAVRSAEQADLGFDGALAASTHVLPDGSSVLWLASAERGTRFVPLAGERARAELRALTLAAEGPHGPSGPDDAQTVFGLVTGRRSAPRLARFELEAERGGLALVGATSQPLLPLLASAPGAPGLRVVSTASGGRVLTLDGQGRVVAVRALPEGCEPASLRALAVAADGTLVVAAADALHMLAPEGTWSRLPLALSGIADVALDERGRVLVAALEPPALHVLDLLGNEVARLAPDATEAGLRLDLERPLAVAVSPLDELLVHDVAAGASARGAAATTRLWRALPRDNGARPRAAISPARVALRPGMLQSFWARVPGDAGVTWTTQTGFFLDTQAPVSHANPAVLVTGARAGEFTLEVEADLPHRPRTRGVVEVSDLPVGDGVLRRPPRR